MTQRLISLASKQLELTAQALQRDMVQFAADQTMEVVKDYDYGELPETLRTLIDGYGKDPYQWYKPKNWRQFSNTWDNVQEVLLEGLGDEVRNRRRLNEASLLRETVGSLAEQFSEAFEKTTKQITTAQEKKHPLATLSLQADLLRSFTEMWDIYRLIWQQRYAETTATPKPDAAIEVGDRLVQSFYDVIREKQLDLIIKRQILIAVPHQTRMYASGFGLLMPYVAMPRYGTEQIWTWLGYLHEIGHHVFRNINGLRDELMVNVMMTLGSLGIDQTMQGIWFGWIEEIFADLFGLLQIGRAFAASQQHMLFYLSPQVIASLDDADPREGLLRSPDGNHPPPHLRVHLALEALKLLGTPANPQLQTLQTRWNDLFLEGVDVDTQNIYIPINGNYKKFPFQQMKGIGQQVLNVMLTTRMYALGINPNEADRTSSSDSGETLPFKQDLKIFLSSLDEGKVNQAKDLMNITGTDKTDGEIEIATEPAISTDPLPDFQYLLTAAQDTLDLLANLLTEEGQFKSKTRGKLIPSEDVIKKLNAHSFDLLKKRAAQDGNTTILDA